MTNAPVVITTIDHIPFEMHHRLARTVEVERVTIEQLMDELGRSRNTILNYISGRTRPSKGDVNTWAGLADVSFFWLWNGAIPTDDGAAITDGYRPPASVRRHALIDRHRALRVA